MKNIYLQKSGGSLVRGLLLAVLLCLGAVLKAAAADSDIHYVLELDKDYDMEVFKDITAEYTAEESGKLTVKSNSFSDVPRPYTDDTYTTQIDHNVTSGKYVIDVEKGKTYYFMGMTLNSGVTFRITMNEKTDLEVTKINPEEGSAFDITGSGLVSLTFSTGVKIGSATLTSGTNTVEISVNTTSQYASLNLKAALFKWMKDGVVKEGDKLVVDVKDIVSVDDPSSKIEDLSLEYLVSAMPTLLESKVLPDNFLSYWEKGDEKGIAKFTFSKDIKTGDGITTGTLSFGSLETEGGYYTENIPLTVTGNTITADFTGKTRNPSELITASGIDVSSVTFSLNRVTDVDGNFAYSESSGSLGSFSYQIPFENSSKNLTWEFTPAPNSSLADQTNIELWLSDKTVLASYTGVDFKKDGTETIATVAKADVKEEADEDGGIALTFAIPEAAKKEVNVTVALAGAQFSDGVSRAISANYVNPSATPGGDFEVTLLRPEKTEIDVLHAGDSIIVSTNKNDAIGLFRYQIRDNNAADPNQAIILASSTLNKSADGKTFGAEFYLDYKLIKGHTYNVEFKAYENSSDDNTGKAPIGEYTIVLTGTSEAFVPSPYKFVSVDPDQSTVLTDAKQNTFKVTFDGSVTLDEENTFIPTGYGTHRDFDSITPEGDDVETVDGKSYSKTWTLVAPTDFMETLNGASLYITIVAYDKEGKRLAETEDSYISLSFETTIGVPDLNITPANGAKVNNHLSTFYVDNSEAVSTSGLVSVSKAVLRDKDGNEVAKVASAEPFYPADQKESYSYNPTRVIVKLDNEISEEGEYTLYFPAQYFIYGTSMQTVLSKEETIKYTLEKLSDKVSRDFTPTSVEPESAEGVTVKNLATLKLNYDKKPYVNPNIVDEVLVYNRMTRNLVATGFLSVEGNSVVIELSDSIKTDGVYTVDIAEGAIGDEAYSTSEYQSGSCNAATTYYYQVSNEVAPSQDVTIDPQEGNVTSLKHFVLTWDNESSVGDNDKSTDRIQLFDKDGNEVTYAGNADIIVGEDWNQMEFDLKDEVTADGTYTLSIPAGRFLLGDMGDRESEAMTFEYTITGASGIGTLFSDDTARYNVYNVSGVLVMSTTKKSELNKLGKGLYIINGKKIIVK